MYETQKYMIMKFSNILNEFPERIIITQKVDDLMMYPFVNDESVFRCLETSDLGKSPEVIIRRNEDTDAAIRDTNTLDMLNSEQY